MRNGTQSNWYDENSQSDIERQPSSGTREASPNNKAAGTRRLIRRFQHRALIIYRFILVSVFEKSTPLQAALQQVRTYSFGRPQPITRPNHRSPQSAGRIQTPSAIAAVPSPQHQQLTGFPDWHCSAVNASTCARQTHILPPGVYSIATNHDAFKSCTSGCQGRHDRDRSTVRQLERGSSLNQNCHRHHGRLENHFVHLQ